MQNRIYDNAIAAVSVPSMPRAAFAGAVVVKLGAVAVLGVLVANCSQQPQTGRRLSAQESREVGFFSGRQWGTASPRVVADGEAVPKGGGRDHIGRSYSVAGRRYTPYAKPVGYAAVGASSWYGAAFHGRKTANGEVYDRHGVSAAHPTMPLPSYARVTNTSNGRSIIVRVNDRGPFHPGRIIDVSQKTAELLAFRHIGTARVRVEYVGRASLAGSDDRMLIASLSTDGSPAAVPGMSQPSTMVASAPPMTPRVAPAVIQSEPEETPAVVASTRQQAPAQVVLASAPVAAVETNRIVRDAPRPPERPFDLSTIPGAATPIAFAGAPPVRAQLARSTTASPRATVAQLYFAQPQTPGQVFTKSHPLAKDLTPQRFVPLASN